MRFGHKHWTFVCLLSHKVYYRQSGEKKAFGTALMIYSCFPFQSFNLSLAVKAVIECGRKFSLCVKWGKYEIVNTTQRSVSYSLNLLWSMSLCLRGNTIISQWIHPSILPSCPEAPQATPNPRTLHLLRDETQPHTPSPLPGASKEPLASTRLTGRRFSLKSNPGERTQAWTARQIDGSTDSQVDTWGLDALMHPGQVERTRRCPQGQVDVNRGWKCVIFL